MPANRPAASGYARIAQAEEEEEDEQAYSDTDDPFADSAVISSPGPHYTPIQPGNRASMRMPDGSGLARPERRRRANSGVDIKAINARLERWADEIKDRFKRRRVKGKSTEEEHLEIHHSVFHAPDWIRPATKEVLENDAGAGGRLSKLEFDDLVESVRTAIGLGLHPKLIAQGSSGSYFARNSGGTTVGVFKPKDEEPYASSNPKTAKWIHRNLFPCFFGRAMLIPNLSYVSEAAAYVLDCQLRTNLVPYTDVVRMSSKSFHYDWMDRRAYYRKGRPLPEKLGSFQVFLKGYKGATEFFREHPWPDLNNPSFRDAPARKKQRVRWDESCRPSSKINSRADAATAQGSNTDEEEDDDAVNGGHGADFWSAELQQSFREELEKLVILDYVMRNTDRGSDNWMIRIDRETNNATIIKEPSKVTGEVDSDGYHRRNESMNASRSSSKGRQLAVPRIGAIDNSLSWPWKHPDAWRSYPFGWLFLPVGLIGRPFSEKTKKHFLPLLTSKHWWSETQVKLRQCFEIDPDFEERMFAKQMAVMKGQAWNVVETLKTPDHGPLELTRRNRVHVWDDLVDIPVAVPLPRASEEMRVRAAAANAEEHKRRALATGTPAKDIAEDEEMDISAAHASASALNDNLLEHLGSSLPNDAVHVSNRFNMSRENSSQNVYDPRSSPDLAAKDINLSSADFRPPPGQRPSAFRSRTGDHRHRVSLDVPRTQWLASPTQSRSRRFSLSFTRRNSEDNGDLGYAATSEREGATKKVIVERLEMVKSRTPVFQCC